MSADNPQQTIRRRLGDSTDPRAVRVRSVLFTAAQRLGRAGRPISVSSLAKVAGVSRSVFYTHFADIADFAIQMQQQHFHALASTFQNSNVENLPQAGLEGQHALVAHFADNRDLYRAVLSLTGPAGIDAGTTAVLRRAITGHIRRFCELPPGLTEDVAATYIAAGITALITAWLSDEHPADEATLAQALMDLMPAWLYGP